MRSRHSGAYFILSQTLALSELMSYPESLPWRGRSVPVGRYLTLYLCAALYVSVST